jgi:hypothetical protein
VAILQVLRLLVLWLSQQKLFVMRVALEHTCVCGTSDDMQPLFGALIGTGFLCEQYDPRLFAARGHVFGFSREVFTDPQLRTSASSKGA